jgi:uncharacterized protein DUF2303
MTNTRPPAGYSHGFTTPEPGAELSEALTRTENDAVADIAFQAARPIQLQPGGYYVIHSRNGAHVVYDLTGDGYRDQPRRITDRVHLHHLDSLLDYFGKHANPHSELWADSTSRRITAIIDAHTDATTPPDTADTGDRGAARWQAHRAELNLHLSDPLEAWLKRDGTPFTQEQFAEFVEEQIGYILIPDGATLQELIHGLEVTVTAEFQQGVRLKTGARRLSFLENIEGRVKDSTVDIPDELTIHVPIWRGDRNTTELHARFRFRPNTPRPGQVALLYKLNNIRETLDGAFEAVISDLAAETGRPVYRGTPPQPHPNA